MTVSLSPFAAGRPNSNVVRFEGPAVGSGDITRTFVVPAGVSVLFLTGCAAGAGGGGGASPSGAGGGGGGHGSFCIKWPVFVQPGEVLTVTLGAPTAGGAAGAASVNAGNVTIASSLGANTRIAPRLSSNLWSLSGGGAAQPGGATIGGNGGSSGLLTGNALGDGDAGALGPVANVAGGLGTGRHTGGAAGGGGAVPPFSGSPQVSQNVNPAFLAATTGDATNGGGGHGGPTPFSRSGQAGNGGVAGGAAYGFGGGGGGGGGGAAGGAGGRSFLEIAW